MNKVIIRIIIFGHKGNEKKRNVQTKTAKKRRFDIYRKRNETIIKKTPTKKTQKQQSPGSLLNQGFFFAFRLL